jgi:hypothetical protein
MLRLMQILVGVMIACSMSQVVADPKTCVLHDGRVVQCGEIGYTAPNGKLRSGNNFTVSDVDYGTSGQEEIVSIRPKNEREFTATFGDGHKSDYYIDRDGSIQKGIPPYSLP